MAIVALQFPASRDAVHVTDMLPHSFNIGRFKSGKNNSTTIKHIHNEPAKLIDSYNVAFDNKDWYNFL